ncbi:hypothetical protein PPL_02668 [Heterostelium album PN500]|uniref:RNA polymerase II subunit A C-terminal domain phosphatase SSU72 n=1 Tax=Heterostelium pallidum (strain ATCC 26659 / Pp 5 / PN500) TaxID=670386 RepID=D3B2Q4_HETP5|nr:hypothetical protein PPL_02668 [Heterostelium album PN500]EFA83602.1 hypothetical protein PPL_02668 [Heterostelium album PN500]|eukprot:XP_020435719.1 hypothetical protein PPL_02668 [Heterostelium album PN500]
MGDKENNNNNNNNNNSSNSNNRSPPTNNISLYCKDVKKQKRLAMVCASNQNRSVEAHNLFLLKGYRNIRSFGTSGNCKLPGPSQDRPNIFPFGTPYQSIHESLRQQNQELYTQNGILNMLERNQRVKLAPEKWQEEQLARFDIVFTFDQRVFDMVVDDLTQRDITAPMQPVHIVNLQVKDTHEEAAGGASHALQLLNLIDETEDNWEDSMDDILEKFYRKTGRQLLYTLMFY